MLTTVELGPSDVVETTTTTHHVSTAPGAVPDTVTINTKALGISDTIDHAVSILADNLAVGRLHALQRLCVDACLEDQDLYAVAEQVVIRHYIGNGLFPT